MMSDRSNDRKASLFVIKCVGGMHLGCLNNGSRYKSEASNSLPETFLLQPSPGAQGLSARFTTAAVRENPNLLSAVVFLTGAPADAVGP